MLLYYWFYCKKAIKCSASLSFYHFSPTCLINLRKYEHSCKIFYLWNTFEYMQQYKSWIGDNCIQNFHSRRYIVGYTVGKVLRQCISRTVRHDFQPYIWQYTFTILMHFCKIFGFVSNESIETCMSQLWMLYQDLIKMPFHYQPSTLFRPMEFPIKQHTIKSGWSIVYIEGSLVL